MKANDFQLISAKTAIAINACCATQTEEKLNRDKVKGKHNVNKTNFEVGKKVRQTIKELGGTMPEDLPVTESIRKIEGTTETWLFFIGSGRWSDLNH